MAISVIGANFCYGQRVTLWELRNVLPKAKWHRLRVRRGAFPELFAKDDNGIRRFYIKKLDTVGFELVEVESNERKVGEHESIKIV